jgi:hypothetical protein
MSREDQVIGPYFVGEKPQAIIVAFTDADGAAINITGYTPQFVIETDAGGAITEAGSAALVSGAGGTAQYTWGAADLATAGWYRGQLWVGNGTTRISSRVFRWEVQSATLAPSI